MINNFNNLQIGDFQNFVNFRRKNHKKIIKIL